MECECPECGVMFEPNRKQLYQLKKKPHNNVFCSIECSVKFRNVVVQGGQKYKNCSHCGTRFKLSVNQRRKIVLDRTARVGCSPECTNKIKATPRPEVVNPPRLQELAKRIQRPKIAHWIPYSGVGGSDFPALMNPF